MRRSQVVTGTGKFPQHGARVSTRPAEERGRVSVGSQAAEGSLAAAAGMRFHWSPQPQDTGWVTYGRDCDGNIIELLEFKDP